MERNALRGWGASTGLMAALIVAAACGGGKKPTTRIDLSRPECPQGRLDIEVVDTVDSVPTVRHITEIPVAGPITNIPEFHDCQRFIGKSGNDLKYGPLVAIFAHHLLDSLYTGQFDPTSAQANEAAGEIYSYDGAYDPLFIRQGFNCLYLRQVTQRDWEAYMTSVGNDEKGCLKPLVRGNKLSVVAKRVAKHESDVPAVARWDYDTVNQRQYIGIKCGGQWCEIGHSGFET